MNASLTRAQRRRLEAAADLADKMVVADEHFFRRFPARAHRVRLASRAEMEANAVAAGLAEVPTDFGQRWYCVVRQIAPGTRARAFVQNDPDVDTDLSEGQAEIVYDLAAPPGSKAHAIEQQIRAALAKRGPH